jgi:hypothetical protein
MEVTAVHRHGTMQSGFQRTGPKYPGEAFKDAKLRGTLKQDSVRIFCKGCFPEDADCADIGDDASTTFTNHLLTSCATVRENAAQPAEVQDGSEEGGQRESRGVVYQ